MWYPISSLKTIEWGKCGEINSKAPMSYMQNYFSPPSYKSSSCIVGRDLRLTCECTPKSSTMIEITPRYHIVSGYNQRVNILSFSSLERPYLVILDFPCQEVNIGECHCFFFFSVTQHSRWQERMYHGVVKLNLGKETISSAQISH